MVVDVAIDLVVITAYNSDSVKLSYALSKQTLLIDKAVVWVELQKSLCFRLDYYTGCN